MPTIYGCRSRLWRCNFPFPRRYQSPSSSL